MLNRRAEPRFDASLPGRLISLDGRYNVRCTVSSVSASGARLAAVSFGDVPERVYLLVKPNGDMFECQIRWRQPGQMGVRLFLDLPRQSERKTLLSLCTPNHAG